MTTSNSLTSSEQGCIKKAALALTLIEQIHAEAETAERAGDHQSHAALHVIEMKLRETRLCLQEAEKVAKGDGLALVQALLGTAA